MTGSSIALPMNRLELPRWAVTAALAVITLVGVPTGIALTGGRVTLDGAVPLAQTLAILVLLRRRWPVATLLASLAAVTAMRGAGLVEVGWIWPVTVFLAHTIVIGRIGWALGTGVVVLAYAANWESVVLGHSPDLVASRVGAEALWLALVLAIGAAYRNRRGWQEELAARVRQSAHERELDARRRRAEERVRIAHELHDVVSHTLAVVGVHLHVALDTLESAPEEARDALRLAQDVRGKAMTDLQALVEVLRDESATKIESPVAQLDRLASLVEQVRTAGVEVSLHETGERSTVPAPVALAAYRIVQEALTNTVRHARATRATVALRYEPAQVAVTVTDNGTSTEFGRSTTARDPGEPETGGHGLAGMRERVTALGGSLRIGPAAEGGFTVQASIPVVGR
ncbi:Signal transduction histidine kinase [Micromonospora viridifaciens]|uniref:histidine kinase n=1 Tax=Micromonospora viridifaciens TaxID=1881 RepID=A0A1C4XRR1_MICVI|nr:histidine kinase [Micromonospora viridifaciens]SCF11200.1 Signal transduction histidine kinase [Micromonospora viridifaciens]